VGLGNPVLVADLCTQGEGPPAKIDGTRKVPGLAAAVGSRGEEGCFSFSIPQTSGQGNAFIGIGQGFLGCLGFEAVGQFQ